MTGTGSLLPLAGFSYDWVGGDIRGLSALAGQCFRIAPEVTTVDAALTRQVAKITSGGGWKGAAASAFSSAWDKDAQAGSELATAWRRIGGIVDDLAAELAGLESALEEAAREVEAQGVGIDPVTGTVAAEIAATPTTPAEVQAAANKARLMEEYASFRQATLDRATVARAAAAGALQAVTEAMLPSKSRDWGQAVDLADGLRALWGAPTVYRQGVQEELPELEQNVASTERAAMLELIQARKLAGNAAMLSKETRGALKTAWQEENAVETKLASAEALENTTTKLAAGDADGIAGVAEGADGLGGLVKGIPYLGTTLAAGLTIYQDRQQHEGWGRSVADGVVSSGAALGAAAGVAGLIGGGSFVAVGAGIVVGGVVAVGVGDFVHNLFQENWSGDWSKYGVMDGTVHGVADSYDKTRHDMAHFADDVGHPVAHVVEHLWDDIF